MAEKEKCTKKNGIWLLRITLLALSGGILLMPFIGDKEGLERWLNGEDE